MGYLVQGRTFPSYYAVKYDRVTPQTCTVYLPNASSKDEAREIARQFFTFQNLQAAQVEKIESDIKSFELDEAPAQLELDKPWYESRLVAFDVETTGLDPAECRIVEIAFSEYDRQSGSFLEPESYLLNEGHVIPEKAASIHGITNEMIEGKPAFSDIFKELKEKYLRPDTVLIAHNRGFDVGFLVHAMARAEDDVVYMPPCMCSMELSIRTPVGQRKNTLAAAAEALNLDGVNSHRAGDDCRLCGELFLALARRNKYWHTASLRDALSYFDHNPTMDNSWDIY